MRGLRASPAPLPRRRHSAAASDSGSRRRRSAATRAPRLAAHIGAAMLQRGTQRLDAVAKKRGIDHGELDPISALLRYDDGTMSATIRKAVFPSGPVSSRPPRLSPRKCWCSWTSPSSSTSGRKAFQSGVNVVIVTGRGKNGNRGPLRRRSGTRKLSRAARQTARLEEIRKITAPINVAYVRG